MLEVRGLCKSWDGRSILRDLDLTVQRCGHTLIMGPSGSGKSTFLHLLSRLERPDSGQILFEGCSIYELGNSARYRLRHLGLVFQDIQLVESLSVRQNIELIQSHSLGPVISVERLIELLGLNVLAHRCVHSLSRGERQRAALARAVANRPPLILADEPTASLDSDSRDGTLDQLFTLAKETMATVIVVSHDKALIERSEFCQTVQLVDGRLRSL